MGRAFEYRKAAKMKRWGNMSKVFPKLSKAITIAAKSGVADPDMNPALRTAIINAKAENMPKDNIDAAIKRATAKDAANLSEVNYEGKSAGGVLVFVETATDNATRTVANIKDIFKKAKGSVVPNGSLEFMFDRKAVIEIKKPDMDIEELELEMIDYGWESFEEDEEILYVYGDYTDFGSLNAGFERLGIEVVKATLQRIPNNPKEVDDETMEDLEKLIEKLEDDEDVQTVYTNLA
ncbi:MAG: YebC/PmpR family DNA-binding transcriptional regulator [Campylobacterales bacterium]|nr:YebC/PmpR family DNA-binding transcriptional regulator [Campylobacterales bacterium]